LNAWSLVQETLKDRTVYQFQQIFGNFWQSKWLLEGLCCDCVQNLGVVLWFLFYYNNAVPPVVKNKALIYNWYQDDNLAMHFFSSGNQEQQHSLHTRQTSRNISILLTSRYQQNST
jgi:hypothetical protein